MNIGIFDSGIGGEAVARSLQNELPSVKLNVVNDKENLPYGTKTKQEITELTDLAIQPLLKLRCDVIVLACNSATAAAITFLRSKYPETQFIGLEPMVKSAAGVTVSGNIAVCATPATLNSQRYQSLLNQYAGDLNVIEPDCSQWAKMIEDNQVNESKIGFTINQCLDRGADVIVLGCTHYHWIEGLIKSIVQGRAIILEPSAAIASQVRALLDL